MYFVGSLYSFTLLPFTTCYVISSGKRHRHLKCRFSILRKAFDLLIDKTRFEKYLKYSILLLFFRFLTDDHLGHRGRTVNWPT